MQQIYQKKKELSRWNPRGIETNNIKLSNKLCCIELDLKVTSLIFLCTKNKFMYLWFEAAGSPWACFPHVIPIWTFCLPSNPKCIQQATIFGRCTVSHKYLRVTLPLTYSSHLVLANEIHCIFAPNAVWRAVPWNQIIKFRKTLRLIENAARIKSVS